MLLLFDSWAWVEYLTKGTKGARVKELFDNPSNIILTTKINLYEVYAKVLREEGIQKAEKCLDLLVSSSRIAEFDIEIIKHAAQLKVKRKFGLADSIILATAIKNNARLITGDPDFKDVNEVEVELL